MTVAAIVAVLVALAVSAAGSFLAAQVGPVDPPGRRTSHARPTPTSGGAAMPAAMGAGLLAYALLAPGGDFGRVGLALLLAAAAGLVGGLDDMLDLDARGKLVFSLAIAVAFAALCGPVRRLPLGAGFGVPLAPVLGVAGGALWIVTVTNAVNFMDGANGLAAGAMAIAFAALAAASGAQGQGAICVAAACAAAACAGFLPFNLAGRLFQGDVGALFAAFLFAALCLAAAAPGERPLSLYFGPIALMPVLADVLLTLLSRARRRAPLFHAHREHLYQRWLQTTGHSHAALAWRAWALTAGFCALAAAASRLGETGQAAALALAVALATAAWIALHRRLGAAA